MRKTGIILAVTTALSLAAAQPVLANTLRWGQKADINSLDPYSAPSSFTLAVLHHIYEPLVRYNQEMKIEPALAVSWERLAPAIWRFKLRQGVKFHNGNPFTADDVVASIKRVSHPDSPLRGNLPAYKDVRKVDDYTVEIEVNGPYPLLLNDLTNIFILDHEWMVENNALNPVDPAKGQEGYATTHANGTGPFKLERRQPDARTDFVVNPHWWDKPQHNLTRIEFRPIASDATRVAALLSGEIDLTSDAPLQDLERLAKTPNLTVLEGPSLRTIMLGFNHRDELHASNVKGKNPLKDVRVRQALYQAINIEQINKKVLRGKARITGSLVAPEIPGYVEALNSRLPYDPDAAKKLLAEAGYPDGFEVGMDCPRGSYVSDEEICLAIVSMWARIGVKANLTVQPRSLYDPKMLGGKTDIYMLGWATLPMLDAYSLLSQLLATKAGANGASNPNGYSNPKLDALTKQASVELDETRRRALMAEALQLAKDDIAMLPLHQQPLSWVVRKNVQVAQTPDNLVRLWYATVK
ncbi:MAG TPA: ABC transporter substrate-binding protein [Candidatus Competibacteraceae bacterium]|nr:ABC transporter substrate-binding protein [Candidatus Competibacteraceae bacterium]